MVLVLKPTLAKILANLRLQELCLYYIWLDVYCRFD